MLNLKKIIENKCKVNVMIILNIEKVKGKILKIIFKINEKIKNTEIEKEKMLI